MVNADRFAGSTVDFHILVPDFAHLISPGEVLQQAVHTLLLMNSVVPDTLVVDSDAIRESINVDRSVEVRGKDITGRHFLHWCLMRGVEVAAAVGIKSVEIVCDAATWEELCMSRRAAEAINPAIRLRRRCFLDRVPVRRPIPSSRFSPRSPANPRCD
ncbi:MAG: hypothetical protein RQ801_08170 [Spirochaetaceae bacterium]|nr:hypothetical protein [Spirochaetaceae bacterium]MDT8298258.1 hypothetical protein [Spirochaetaceae bacterium]